ncbi:permease-like cell division protein FtsX [Legionella oakridgensis]|uniref:Cell division protein FtsX n=2 Tax=Legionella oakridgensis TaxID=29423 RepID=W0BE93_9GAMM|nr:permease-like cell division protein FtsX [Legionella oakridgensis]AHE68190.1 cell division protein [Legionella oakridgensis ATCC 33761 = DSM 21215]KTD39611.1 cell division ATP transporter FtsX [Legionella oakridgensis]STY21153.1 cell division transport system permease protein [Legionella longbeachae]
MLTKLHTYFDHHREAMVASIRLFGQKPFAAAMTMMVIAITLALPALFWVFAYNLEQLTNNWQQGGRISLYLKPSLSSQEAESVLLRVRTLQGVAQAVLKSPEEGLAELKTQEGMEDIMEYLSENPLPAVIDITPELNVDAPAKLEQLYLQLKSYPQVEQAKIDMQWVNRLHAILGLVTRITHGLMLILASAVLLIIGNTLRLAIQNRREEIQILKLIGATDPFILRPFLYSGILYGLAGAIFAVLVVNLFMLSLALAMRHLATAFQIPSPFLILSFSQALLLICSATILGWLGARLSVKRQLASIEPYS